MGHIPGFENMPHSILIYAFSLRWYYPDQVQWVSSQPGSAPLMSAIFVTLIASQNQGLIIMAGSVN
jgi:hypothetical protein